MSEQIKIHVTSEKGEIEVSINGHAYDLSQMMVEAMKNDKGLAAVICISMAQFMHARDKSLAKKIDKEAGVMALEYHYDKQKKKHEQE